MNFSAACIYIFKPDQNNIIVCGMQFHSKIPCLVSQIETDFLVSGQPISYNINRLTIWCVAVLVFLVSLVFSWWHLHLAVHHTVGFHPPSSTLLKGCLLWIDFSRFVCDFFIVSLEESFLVIDECGNKFFWKIYTRDLWSVSMSTVYVVIEASVSKHNG